MRNTRNSSFPTVLLIAIVAMLVCGGFLVAASKPQAQAPDETRFERPRTPEEKAFVREAHRLGTRLFAIAKRADDLALRDTARQVKLEPVYNQIEDFILHRLNSHTDRIASITVTYDCPGLQCMIFVKEGEEAELEEIKKIADTCVGRIIENLPMVQYLMVRHENGVESL